MAHAPLLYRTADGPVAETDGRYVRLDGLAWGDLFRAPDPHGRLQEAVSGGVEVARPRDVLAPVEAQEVWAAGVTYQRSRTARMAESETAGGGSFYDRVYAAERPELFFKATPHRVAGPGDVVRIRRDSRWTVPEPELALAVTAGGRLFGYTVGNDVSARDIEGENPLYLPQAKVYDGSCALGPALLVAADPLPPETAISLVIVRGGDVVFDESITLASLKRTPEELVAFLLRDNSFPDGCFLLTGTGIVPPDDFALRAGDRVRITIDPIGTLENDVVQG